MKAFMKINSAASENLSDSRVSNSIRATIIGLMAAFLTTFIPFVMRILMMQFMGEDYVGLNSVIISVTGLLNMAELGIGPVMVFFLYEPAASGDQEKVNAYLMEMRRLYRWVAVSVLAFGLIALPFLPKMVSGGNPLGTEMYLAYICYLSAYVMQYVAWPEMAACLTAFQRMDVQYAITIVGHIATYAAQIMVIILYRSLLLYSLITVAQTVFTGLMQKHFGNRYFPGFFPVGSLAGYEKREVKVRILSMLGHQMDERVLGSVDNVFISAILGLGAVAAYGNYALVVTAVTMLLNTIYTSVLSSIGNAAVVETRDSNLVRFNCILFLSGMIAGWSSLCMACLFQPFMRIWMPQHLLPMDVVVLLCVYSYVTQMRRTVQTFKNAMGMWYNDRFKPYVSIAADLVLDWILITKMGVIGAVLSTIVCIAVIEMPWEMGVLYRDYFKDGISDCIKRFAVYTAVNLLLCIMAYFMVDRFIAFDGLVGIAARGVVCTVLAAVFYLAVYFRTEEFGIWRDTLLDGLGGAE